MNELIIKLNPDEANAALQLFEVAIKVGGIGNARAALPLVDKILIAANEMQKQLPVLQAEEPSEGK